MTSPQTDPRPSKINFWLCLAIGLFGALSSKVFDHFVPHPDLATRIFIAVVGAAAATALLIWGIWKFIRA
ncbi:hypothetical protein [Sphingomonas immobilis]|uniref:DUF2970 domain-containing protein n=1 Tax=Sphingomonas immobilis TaxID=3063997 RepID=A0ABT8ZXP7_9SPHN|nr:hypothetical protein [Sphingomonas sp. CA1-15]MDO7842355.1 hypothetical protein [Sphingomonas sp. CA1-15]